MQSLAEIVALDQIAEEYSPLVQASGLRTTIIDVCRQDATSPDDLRRMLTRTLQNTMPRTTLASIRADGSALPTDRFAVHEQRVKTEIIEQAHKSPTLRTVTETDRSGREITTYYGAKSSWMSVYKAPAMLTKTIGGAPPKLPVVL